MAERVTAKERRRLQNLAETEILRYQHDHALWHKHVHDVTLDPMQVLKCLEMDKHQNTVDNSCRRTGKTAVKEMWIQKYLACNPDQELGIVAPKEAQSLVNLGYHLDAIRRSDILSNFIEYRNGRKQMSDTYYRFANRSIARGYGIFSQIDGGDLTIASIEEVDDLDQERLNSRFLLTMGSTRRLGADEDAKNDPIIRITGVFKGASVLSNLLETKKYHLLPTVDCHLGVQLGILNGKFIDDMKVQLSPEEYIRQLLCINTSSTNLIWEKYIRAAIQTGAKVNVEMVVPEPGSRYKKRGLLSFGYDAAGHGESANASKHAFIVSEQVGNYVVILFAKTWAPGTDDTVVKNDLLAFWRYFRPDYAIGDAYGLGMLTQLNHDLFAEGLTDINIRAVNDGESNASAWNEWAFAPLRFEGSMKHNMAQALRAIFHHLHAVIPYVDHLNPTGLDAESLAVSDMQTFIKQLSNIRPEETTKSYSSYVMVLKKIGDDLFDAAMASIWGLATRGNPKPATVVATTSRTRDELLGTQMYIAGN
ncbi:hypothetical protein [Alteromonas sp. RKMC-009]|uniref:hypothetical protein n=1 Tax=Alteromonas sp. RKMC-009 TaxID=2267264 RepID=UPI000E6965B5|nr:hypothetical protein [Alteromonas sp. RKMC-009]AYA63816.1 hypothetical protein DS731_07280 [Alteromonas sp. RKMC-009]